MQNYQFFWGKQLENQLFSMIIDPKIMKWVVKTGVLRDEMMGDDYEKNNITQMRQIIKSLWQRENGNCSPLHYDV